MKQEQIQKQHHRRPEQPIDDMPPSIYDQELDAVTELCLSHIELVLDDPAQ
jgi:hypothetical protein